MIEYLFSSALWGLAGFVLGMVAGHAWKGDMLAESRRRLIGVALVVVSIFGVTAVAIQTYRLGQAIECQADYNRAFASALAARTESARVERENERNLWLAFLANAPREPGQQNPEGRDASIKALNNYLAGLERGNRDRRESPLPTRKCL